MKIKYDLLFYFSLSTTQRKVTKEKSPRKPNESFSFAHYPSATQSGKLSFRTFRGRAIAHGTKHSHS